MTYKNDKIRDLTPLVTSFVPGESPTAEKLQGMMRQADSAIEYLENKIGDLAGEEGQFNTWVATLARNLGDFSKLNPHILPAYELTGYTQNLTLGAVEHEMDMIPVGSLNDLIDLSSDSSVSIGQYKNTVELLETPGDWTIVSSYVEAGNIKRGRKLVTHAPSEGGSIIFKKVTSGRGSSLESASENTIPNLAQAENDGPFVSISVIDSNAKIYEVTLPVRTKMYDKLGAIVDFSASNKVSSVGLNSQYELPKFFFGLDGLGLDTDDTSGFSKQIPLNLIKLYDWNTKREVEGIIFLQAATSSSARKYQFIMQTESDIILNVASGKYVIVVAANSIATQLSGLTQIVYGNTGVGNDMTRLISHKNLLDLRTGTVSITNRSKYYGPSNIINNDHSMYFHRDGFTDTDKGAGGNIIRGHVVIGSNSTGASDSIHENYNVDSDSNSLYFGNIAKGPEIKYAKFKTYNIDHAYGGLTTGIIDCGLWIQGAVSDLNSARKNIFLEGDIRTSGNIVLGHLASDTIFMQGKVYINDELTFIPRTTAGTTAEEGKLLYSSLEKAIVFYNGSKWISPWAFSGYTVVIGDGINSFGKYNGQSYSTFTSALDDVAYGGTIKVLAGNYNILGNTITLPTNVILEGAGNSTTITGTGTLISMGSGSKVCDLLLQNAAIGILVNTSNCVISRVNCSSLNTAIQITSSANDLRILENVNFFNCIKTTEYTGASLIKTVQTVSKNAICYSGSTVNDWSLKDEILNEYVVKAGSSIVTFENALPGAMGKGAFKIVGDGTIVSKKMLPVNINVGIAGHINIVRGGATGGASVGVDCYSADYAYLGTRYFILSGFSLLNTSMDQNFYKAMMVGTSGYTGLMFPVDTRFVQPIIDVTLSSTGIVFDSFEIFNMTYARASSWS